MTERGGSFFLSKATVSLSYPPNESIALDKGTYSIFCRLRLLDPLGIVDLGGDSSLTAEVLAVGPAGGRDGCLAAGETCSSVQRNSKVSVQSQG
jgi:hypothetical protein